MNELKKNKIITAILAAVVLNIFFTLKINMEVSKTYSEHKVYMNSVEKRFLELIKSEKSKLSELNTATEYVITEKNKEDMINNLLKSVATYENAINEHEKLYLEATKKLLQAKDQEERARLEKIISNIEGTMSAYRAQHSDNYSEDKRRLEYIFNVDIDNK